MRVIYRADLDGIVCVAMLMDLGLCEELKQAHPKDIQDRIVEVTDQDIICGLPYHTNCNMWFGRHSFEINRDNLPFKGLVEVAPSSARQVYMHFLSKHPELKKYEQIVYETDLLENANLTLEKVRNPKDTILFGFLLDPRTGLGLSHNFTMSNFQWSSQLPELLTRHPVHEILEMPDTQERIHKYNEMKAVATDFYSDNSYLDGNVIVIDVRGKVIPPTNRFLIYTLPRLENGNISVRIADGKKGEFNTISVAHSIFNRTSNVDSGEICRWYGGGGHKGAATCQPSLEESDQVFKEIIETCKE